MTNKKNIDLTLPKKIKDSFFEPSVYPGFQKRMIATLIDCTIVSILFLPLFSIIGYLIYGNVFPQELINQAIQDVSAIKQETGKNIDFLTYVRENKELNDYFYINHGFIKMFLEQLLQIITLGILLVVFWIKKQATPGSMMLSMKIVDATSLGNPSTKQCIIRLFSIILSVAPLFLGVFWIVFDKKKQSWHDKISNTLVISVEKNKK
ncbi:MAG: RDD family protein [Rickettsiales bacterium]